MPRVIFRPLDLPSFHPPVDIPPLLSPSSDLPVDLFLRLEGHQHLALLAGVTVLQAADRQAGVVGDHGPQLDTLLPPPLQLVLAARKGGTQSHIAPNYPRDPS